jgi:hypothetical protein
MKSPGRGEAIDAHDELLGGHRYPDEIIRPSQQGLSGLMRVAEGNNDRRAPSESGNIAIQELDNGQNKDVVAFVARRPSVAQFCVRARAEGYTKRRNECRIIAGEVNSSCFR